MSTHIIVGMEFGGVGVNSNSSWIRVDKKKYEYYRRAPLGCLLCSVCYCNSLHSIVFFFLQKNLICMKARSCSRLQSPWNVFPMVNHIKSGHCHLAEIKNATQQGVVVLSRRFSSDITTSQPVLDSGGLMLGSGIVKRGWNDKDRNGCGSRSDAAKASKATSIIPIFFNQSWWKYQLSSPPPPPNPSSPDSVHKYFV